MWKHKFAFEYYMEHQRPIIDAMLPRVVEQSFLNPSAEFESEAAQLDQTVRQEIDKCEGLLEGALEKVSAFQPGLSQNSHSRYLFGREGDSVAQDVDAWSASER